MFVDYVALMLVNLVAGLVMLAHFVYRGLDAPDKKRWAPGLATVGLVALATGLHVIFNWPLPGSYNGAFGEPYVMFGALFLGAALAASMNWDLVPVTIYAFFAGVAAVVGGLRIIDLNMTRQPVVSGIGFILSGLAGIGAPLVYWQRASRVLRVLGALVLLGAAAIWAVTGYLAVWGHIADFAEWVPATMR